MEIEWSYLLLLGGLWFLFYWIFGGAFFALISVFRLGRLKKLRFSCLFSLFSLAAAFGGAWAGMRLAQSSATECLALAQTNVEGFVGFFGCSLVALTVSFLGGAAAVILLGLFSLRLSSSKLVLPVREQKERPVRKEKGRKDDSPLA